MVVRDLLDVCVCLVAFGLGICRCVWCYFALAGWSYCLGLFWVCGFFVVFFFELLCLWYFCFVYWVCSLSLVEVFLLLVFFLFNSVFGFVCVFLGMWY